jgi:hypothetical protein
LNAWHKISETSAKAVVPSAERDAVVFNLIRLDPHHRHVSYNFNTVSDLPTLWVRVAEAKVSQPPPATLYPLAASKMKLEEKSKDAPAPEDTEMIEQMISARQEQTSPTPAAAVTQNGFIRAGAGLISNAMIEMD